MLFFIIYLCFALLPNGYSSLKAHNLAWAYRNTNRTSVPFYPGD